MIIGLLLTVFLILALYLMSSEDKTKKRIGKATLVVIGILVVLPVAAAIIFLMTCFGIIGLGSIGH